MPSDPVRLAEARADAILAQIPQADLEALADVLARLLISAARNEGGPRRTIGRGSTESGASARKRRPGMAAERRS